MGNTFARVDAAKIFLRFTLYVLFVQNGSMTWVLPTLSPSPPVIIDHKHVGRLNKTTGVITQWECADCPAGMGLSVRCGGIVDIETGIECVPCKKNTFSSSRGVEQCQPCTTCSNNEVKTGTCTDTKDTIKCVCKLGHYREQLSRACMPCSWCCGDNTNYIVSECKNLQHKHCSYQVAKECAPTLKPTNSTGLETTVKASTVTPKNNILTEENDEHSTAGEKRGGSRSEQKGPPDKANNTEKIPTEGSGTESKDDSLSNSSMALIIALPCCVLLVSSIMAPVAFRRGRESTRRSGATCSYDTERETVTINLSDQSACEEQRNHLQDPTSPTNSSSVCGTTEEAPLLESSGNNREVEQSTAEPSEGEASCSTSLLSNAIEVQDETNITEDIRHLNKEQKLDLQTKHIPYEILSKICPMLDNEDPFFHDYRMFAEKLGIPKERIRTLGQHPTHSLLTECELTVRKFLKVLEKIEREDVAREIESWLNQG